MERAKFITGHAGASEYLERQFGIRRSPATLAKYRCAGAPGGVTYPAVRRAGRDVLYIAADLDRFAADLVREPRAAAHD